MTLLFVGTNRGGGGTESHFITMATAMAAAGHDVAAVVWPDDVIHQALAADGRVRLFPGRFRVRNDVGATRDVMRIARTLRPDWLIGTFKFEYWPLGIAARLLRLPIVLFSHLDQRMQPLMAHGLPRLVDQVIAPSEYQRERLLARGMPPDRVAVLHNPFDTRHYRVDPAVRAEMRARLGFTPDDVVVGFVGRLEAGKGVEPFAAALGDAMDADARVRALWVGHGECEGALRATAETRGHAPRHAWVPWSADVFPYYAAMDLLALPSTGPETFGRALVEAQACGVPVLGSRNGGIPETMDDGATGLLLPPGDVPAWTSAILHLAADAPRRARMGAAARAFVLEQFDATSIAARFTALLETLAPARGGGWGDGR
jgi:glycosyltransferase involved in cell wall biosynthesis